MLPALPNEIWIQVFEALIDIDSAVDESESESSRKVPNIISWTCSRWRQIALSTPTLWTHIVVPYKPFKPDGGLDEIKTWVKRSGSASLDVEISYGYDEQEACLKLLLLHSDRWRSFRGYKLVDWEDTPSIFDWLPDVIPKNIQLIHLETHENCDRVAKGHILFGGAQTTFLKLVHLTIDEVSINWKDHPFATPSLKYLSLGLGRRGKVIPLQSFVALLNGCPGLEELRMARECVDFTGIVAHLHLQHSVSLPNLHTLSTDVYYTDLHSSLNVLRLLREPTVKTFEVHGETWGWENVWAADQYALEASSAMLGAIKQLRLLGIFLDHEDEELTASLTSFLGKTTGLQQLEFMNGLQDQPYQEQSYSWLLGILKSELCPELRALGVMTIPDEAAVLLRNERPLIQTYLLRQ